MCRTLRMKVSILLAGAVAPALAVGTMPRHQLFLDTMPLVNVEAEEPIFVEIDKSRRGLLPTRLSRQAAPRRPPIPIPRTRMVLQTTIQRVYGPRPPRFPNVIDAFPPAQVPRAAGPLSRVTLRSRFRGAASSPVSSAPSVSLRGGVSQASQPAVARPRVSQASQPAVAGPAGRPPMDSAKQREVVSALRQQIVAAMEQNVKASEAEQPDGSPRRYSVATVLPAVMSKMSPRSQSGQLLLKDLKDPVTGITILETCLLQYKRILGVGGVGVVVAMSVVEEKDQVTLGAPEFAVKLMFEDFSKPEPDGASIRASARSLLSLYNQELVPLRTATRRSRFQGAAQSAKQILSNNQWAMPLYQANIGNPNEPMYVHEGFGFINKALVSDIMLGDGSAFIRTSQAEGRSAPISVQAKELVCYDLMKAVAKFHDVGMCHQDIKPDNVLISKDGTARLTDFGMAGRQGEPRLCLDKLTPLFMDPALASCAISGQTAFLNARYDAWSTGMTAYAILTNGSLPFGLENAGDLLLYLERLDQTYPARSTGAGAPNVADPTIRLLELGVSKEMTAIVGGLLNRNKFNRDTVQSVIQKYPSWPVR